MKLSKDITITKHMSNRFVKLSEAARLTGLGPQSISRYAKLGTIKFILTAGGQRLYNIIPLLATTETTETISKIKVCYCRVSTHGQKDDLQRQIAYMSERYPEYEIISDVGSGINFKRPGLTKLIDYAIDGNLETLVVAYKDRLCRIGYDLIEHILKKHSNTEIIIDAAKTETLNEEIANDILQIVTVYSAKINGMRSYKKQ